MNFYVLYLNMGYLDQTYISCYVLLVVWEFNILFCCYIVFHYLSISLIKQLMKHNQVVETRAPSLIIIWKWFMYYCYLVLLKCLKLRYTQNLWWTVLPTTLLMKFLLYNLFLLEKTLYCNYNVNLLGAIKILSKWRLPAVDGLPQPSSPSPNHQHQRNLFYPWITFHQRTCSGIGNWAVYYCG